MSDHDRDPSLDEAIAQLIERASSDAPQPPDVAQFTEQMGLTDRRRPRHRIVLATAVASLLVISVGTLLIVNRNNSAPNQAPSSVMATNPTTIGTDDTTVATTAPPRPGSTSPVVTAPSTAPPTDAPADVSPLTRPYIQSPVCDAQTAVGPTRPLHAQWLRFSSNPVPIQVLGSPTGGPLGPFIILQRYFGDERVAVGDSPTAIGDTDYWTTVTDTSTVVQWSPGDGSLGVAQARGVDIDELLALVAGLTPRDQTAAIPGFDYDADEGGLELLEESLDTDLVAEVSRFTCITPTSGRFRISAINGSPATRFGALLDRPIPLSVEQRGPTLLIVNGPADPTAPATSDVTQTSAETWAALAPVPVVPDADDNRQPIGDDLIVEVPLQTVGGTGAGGTVSMSTRVDQGVTSLLIDTTDVALAPDAMFWQTDLDPGGGGVSTARVGGVLGFTLGPAPFTVPITVEFSTLDGGEFILQTTGPILLQPS